MTSYVDLAPFIADIQYNCDISDARDHGIYSMCTMVLKLRNLYKWENGLQPWEEPASAELLAWIDGKEKYWETIAGESFRSLSAGGKSLGPLDLEEINGTLAGAPLMYGAGYGRSMKAVFFLAEKLEERREEGCPVVILGRERAREMASPFAMAQDGRIIIRRDALRFFLWDQIQEVRSSCRKSLHLALQDYEVFREGNLDRERLRARLDDMVDGEIDLFVYHEVGEILQTVLDSTTLQEVVGRFPGTAIEFVGRTIKDVLADTHPRGLLAYVVRERRLSSLGFYLTFLDGLRSTLFPEILAAWPPFVADRDWRRIEEARRSCWTRMDELAGRLKRIAARIGAAPDEEILRRFNREVLEPLGLGTP